MTPSAMSIAPLGSLVDRGHKPREPASDDEVWNLNLDQIEPHTGRVLSKNMVSASELGPSTYAFDRGTVLYSKLRPYLNKVVVADDDGVATTELVPLRCDASRLNAQYLAYFLRGPDFLRFATNVVAGAKMPRMVMSEFWGFPVPLPPLPEQRRIAAILDQADALRAKRREALAQLDSLTQSIFIEMFGHPLATQTKWPVETLGLACTKVSDGTHHSPPIVQSGVPYITAKHLKETGLDFHADPWYVSEADHRQIYSRCDPRQGDVLYIKDGATTGKAAINKYDFEFSMLSSLALLRPKRGLLEAQYLCCWLNNPVVRAGVLGAMAGAAIRRLTLTKIKMVPIPLPPIQVQQEFSRRVAALDVVREHQSLALVALDALFASLQHRAFAGQLS